jgi:hypothetical protein
MVILNPASLVAMVCLAFIVAFYWMHRVFDPGALYSYAENQISILDSAIAFGHTDKTGPTVAVLGTATNSTDIPWHRVRFHVEFQDATGRRIDAGQELEWDLVLPPHAALAFKVSLRREFEMSNYVHHIVRVANAQDARSRF